MSSPAVDPLVPCNVTGKRVWVAGHNGMVGSAVVRRLGSEPIGELITASSSQVDLTRQSATEQFVSPPSPTSPSSRPPASAGFTPTARRWAGSSTTT